MASRQTMWAAWRRWTIILGLALSGTGLVTTWLTTTRSAEQTASEARLPAADAARGDDTRFTKDDVLATWPSQPKTQVSAADIPPMSRIPIPTLLRPSAKTTAIPATGLKRTRDERDEACISGCKPVPAPAKKAVRSPAAVELQQAMVQPVPGPIVIAAPPEYRQRAVVIRHLPFRRFIAP